MKLSASFYKGFTLIELLIVIAVLGILATVVLVALNPIEQTRRAKDSGRVNTIVQLGHSLQAYATTQGGVYPPATPDWMTTLVSSGEINQAVSVDQTGTPCTTNASGGICYDVSGNDIVVWTPLESTSSKTKPNPDCTAGFVAVYSSLLGKAGIMCTNDVNSISISSGTVLY